MLSPLILLFVFCLVLSLFLAACVAIGVLIHWLIPGVDAGAGAVVAALGLITARRALAWMLEEGTRNRVEKGDRPDGSLPRVRGLSVVFGEPRPRRRRKPRESDTAG
jgi:hypothetical protein